jgi:ssDNA-binding Zn-finger/Zn-ribbon topoisomerase 1
VAAENPSVGARVARAGKPVGTACPTDETRRATVADQAQTYNGYCVKCKEKRDFEGHVEVSKTGMNMAKGKCPVCGTTMMKFLPSK